jgi:hypothetical protein
MAERQVFLFGNFPVLEDSEPLSNRRERGYHFESGKANFARIGDWEYELFGRCEEV